MIRRLPKKPLDQLNEDDLGGRRPNTVCVVRYGGIGDVIMMTSVLPELKKQFERVCVNVTPRGYDILRNNPHIDEFFIQEPGQIPIYQIDEYWSKLSPLFDKFINLSESVESRLLLQPPRLITSNGRTISADAHPDYFKPQEEVHAKYNRNYVEETHKISEVPFSHNPQFFPTRNERRWAKRERDKIKSKYVVMIVLSGTSTHKVYPFTDAVIARILLKRNDISFIMVGEPLCKILEAGWEKEKRVLCKSGDYTIRQTLSLLNEVDAVIGPETGVMNAASMLPLRKIVYLSHSSVENLTKHWKNTRAIAANVPCHPCHRMHNGTRYCNIHEETGAAKCTMFDPQYIIEDLYVHLP